MNGVGFKRLLYLELLHLMPSVAENDWNGCEQWKRQEDIEVIQEKEACASNFYREIAER